MNKNNACERIERIVNRWAFGASFQVDPLLFAAFKCITLEPMKSIKSIRLYIRNRNIFLQFNYNYVSCISDELLETILADEGLRVILKHVTTRNYSPKYLSHYASNLVLCDEQHKYSGVVKLALNREALELPQDCSHEQYFLSLVESRDAVNQAMLDTVSYGSFANVMEQLLDISNITDASDLDTVDLFGSFDSIEEETETEEESVEKPKQWNELSDEEQIQFYKENGLQEQMFLLYLSSVNGQEQSEGWDEDPMANTFVEAILEDVVNDARSYGSVSGKYIDKIKKAWVKPIDWRKGLKDFKNSVIVCREDYSRLRLNRRYGLEQPGKLKKFIPYVYVFVDTSGSVSKAELDRALGAISQLFTYAKIVVCTFDTEIKDEYPSINQCIDEMDVSGRGGTNCECITEYLEDKPKVDGCIIITDGGFSEFTEPKCNTCFLLHDTRQTVPVDFGTVLFIEKD